MDLGFCGGKSLSRRCICQHGICVDPRIDVNSDGGQNRPPVVRTPVNSHRSEGATLENRCGTANDDVNSKPRETDERLQSNPTTLKLRNTSFGLERRTRNRKDPGSKLAHLVFSLGKEISRHCYGPPSNAD